MTSATVTLFFALLAAASLLAVGVAVTLTILAVRSPGAADLRNRLAADLRGQALSFAAVVASFATLGSLYLSEVIGYPPCTLCWVQRGFMYPLALLLVVAAATGWEHARRPARIGALLGAAVSLWHIAIERVPALQGTAVCEVSNPCSVRWVEHLGFITIPVMALAAFLLIATLLSVRPDVPAASAPDLESVS